MAKNKIIYKIRMITNYNDSPLIAKKFTIVECDRKGNLFFSDEKLNARKFKLSGFVSLPMRTCFVEKEDFFQDEKPALNHEMIACAFDKSGFMDDIMDFGKVIHVSVTAKLKIK